LRLSKGAFFAERIHTPITRDTAEGNDLHVFVTGATDFKCVNSKTDRMATKAACAHIEDLNSSRYFER
jgi:hypothetical protein